MITYFCLYCFHTCLRHCHLLPQFKRVSLAGNLLEHNIDHVIPWLKNIQRLSISHRVKVKFLKMTCRALLDITCLALFLTIFLLVQYTLVTLASFCSSEITSIHLVQIIVLALISAEHFPTRYPHDLLCQFLFCQFHQILS